jgi:glutathione S-transferase
MISDARTTIVKDITISAPADMVFAALTDPKQLTQWWGDGVHRWESDLRAGGRWASYGTFEDGTDFLVKGVYRVIQPPTLVDMTVEHWGTDEETMVRYELTEREGKTRLRVRHSGFTTQQFLDAHSHGWDQTLSRLVAFVPQTKN